MSQPSTNVRPPPTATPSTGLCNRKQTSTGEDMGATERGNPPGVLVAPAPLEDCRGGGEALGCRSFHQSSGVQQRAVVNNASESRIEKTSNSSPDNVGSYATVPTRTGI